MSPAACGAGTGVVTRESAHSTAIAHVRHLVSELHLAGADRMERPNNAVYCAGDSAASSASSALSCQSSRITICVLAATGTATNAAANAPKGPPIQLPIEPPMSTARKITSGLVRTVRLM